MKTVLSLLLILAVNLTFGQVKDKHDKLFDSLIVIGQYDEIIKYFEKELIKQPKNEAILRKLGYVFIIQNDFETGEKYYLEALAVNPKCARCYVNIGRIYALKEDNRKALGFFDKAVKTDPADALVYANRAQFKKIMGDGFGASSDFDKAIDLDSTNADYYISRAQYNSKARYPSLALADFTKAISLSPSNGNAYFERATFYYEQKRLQEALLDVNKALELENANYSFYIARGAIYNAMGQYEKSILNYNQAISLNKSDYLSYLNRASSYYHLENLDASCSDYTLLNAQIENGKINDPEMIKEIKNAIQDICNPSNPSYYYQRGIGFYNLKEYQKALAIYTEGLTKFPESAMMLAFKGNTLLAINEYQNALDLYQLSLKNKQNYLTEIKINPRFSNATSDEMNSYYEGSLATTYFSISECKVNLGDFNGALVDVNNALELAPNIKEFKIESYFNLRGYIYLMKGKYELAIHDFTKSITENKNFPLAYVNRAIAQISMSEKIKISSYSIRGNLSNQPLNLNWNLSNKSSVKKSETRILSALKDCDIAIQLNENLGFAYYIRGQIKQILGRSDGCFDLLMAQKLGLTVEAELLIDCK